MEQDQNQQIHEEKLSQQRRSSIQNWDNDYIDEELFEEEEQDPKWIHDIEIMFPKQKSGFFKSYLVYEIVFKIDNNKKRVFRRFKDFSALRNILRKYLPCIYIYPAHKKQIHLTNDTEFTMERKQELQKFLNYLLKNRPLFDCEPLWLFFNCDVQETECGEQLSKLTVPKMSLIFQKYQQIFFDLVNSEFEQRDVDQVNFFGDKLQTNVEFFQSFEKEEQDFMARLIIPLYGCSDNYSKLTQIINSIKESYNANQMNKFQSELDMLVKKLQSFSFVFEDYEIIENLKKKNEEELIHAQTRKNSVLQKKLNDYKKVAENIEKEIKILINKGQVIQDYFAFVTKLILIKQMPMMKLAKKIIYSTAIKEFAQIQLKKIQQHQQYWEEVVESTENIINQFKEFYQQFQIKHN